ncbi:L-aspartate oxidase [Candidatus Poribacteria bacterium]|nr:L-aspartate oxidase [Candidatus Poribacteria bacterium]MYH79664.1 L-aspartate oxidase [Candidatus Poribacteria bacterium]MYK93104.1 L-aspartate oxidase [Candidatus Poribacteria bacterium]
MENPTSAMNPEAHLKWDTDVLIIGSGAAGLRAALAASEHANVTLITKTTLTESNTHYAQGGIAVAMNLDDTIALHIKDTCAAGAGLCNVEAVEMMVSEGIPRVAELLDWGANFDWEGTLPRFTREAAHSRRRIVHKGDATGRETTDVLIQRVLNTERIHVLQNTFAIDLLTDADVESGGEDATACYGVTAIVEQQIVCIRAKATILATGGLGRIYPCTSNPKVATGDGFAAAWRAGCEMIDMEFVQFHPTTLFLDGAPNFLISEAVRGEGGKLLSIRGERFMEKYHEKGELAPRDVVSRAIQTEMDLTGFPCVFLDITHKPEDFILERFPTISDTTKRYGLNINMDLIPVRPGAHFMMGGIRTNTDTQTNLKGLYACGEVACTGVHGANRLASNSLLECLVYGARAGTNAATFANSYQSSVISGQLQADSGTATRDSLTDNRKLKTDDYSIESIKDIIRETLWKNVSIERNGEGLKETLAELQDLMESLGHVLTTPEVADVATVETVNMLNVALMITQSALARTESRGAHYRADFPIQEDTEWQRRILITRNNTLEAISL